ncbi:hypothetical protein B0A48_00060 [Cryoendolithus antarcticus]|uniref:Uncharacterized protein n=1 Tax=Cryoendolithus antarcticus TaxID=1507870 RepID=A0A1V8TTM0_9PEZI|nr:hypothetical protein B0A48_00060 [Cryoendolithus antarcticus]
MAYFDEHEVQFPPHTGPGKHPLATTQLIEAGLHEDLIALVHLLPFAAPSRSSDTAISPGNNTLTYFEEDSQSGLNPEIRMFGYDDQGDVTLPSWALRLTAANNRNDSQVIYDMRNKTLSEISLYETTMPEFEKAARPAGELLQQWMQNLRFLEWIPWRPSVGNSWFHVRTRVYEDELRFERSGQTIDPPKIPAWVTAEQAARLSQVDNILTEINKAQHNEYWSRRLIFESAGWPETFDRQAFRDGIDEWEWEWTAIYHESMRTHIPLMIGDDKFGKVMREYFRRAAGEYAV